LVGETEVLGQNLPQRHFVHHKSHPYILLNGAISNTTDKMINEYLLGMNMEGRGLGLI
jgi:hypothetical protein